MLIKHTPLTSDGCDGRAMSSTANDRFVLGSLDASIPRDGGYEVLVTRGSVGKFLDGGGKGIRRDDCRTVFGRSSIIDNGRETRFHDSIFNIQRRWRAGTSQHARNPAVGDDDQRESSARVGGGSSRVRYAVGDGFLVYPCNKGCGACHDHTQARGETRYFHVQLACRSSLETKSDHS